ncbi:Crp/Fnr family transcriptional regulator [Spirillospora sp. NPDC048911]|uniref:Crp/Fnr family transcriptional regulator n=1 Tax=Spirillospora sp. NPDC048911 TaxID=3364527 RepID=UPI00371D9BAD
MADADEASIRMDVLDDEQREALRALGSEVRYPAEHTIFLEGEPSHSVLFIQEGHLKVTQRDTDREVILAIRGEDELIGEEGVLMDEPRSATVTTITPVTALDIRAADLIEFVKRYDLWVVMYRAAVRRRRQSDHYAMLARLDVRSRLARWLVALADEAELGEKVQDGWAIGAALSQQDFAGRIGASRDAVAIELRRFRDQKLVSTGRRKIVIHDLEALRQISLL